MPSANGMLLCNFTRLSKKTFHTFISILILLQSISAFAANELDLDSDGIENQFDAFETNAAASVDNDKDGFPDEWNSTCLAQCQVDSGLIQDSFLNDTDNDGVPNDIDSDLDNDNGKPTLLTAPKEIHATVNADDGSGIIINSIDIDNLVAQISAVDAVDQPSMLTPKAYLNNIELIPDEAGVVILPSGFHIISWVVVDRSGNESDSLEQFVYIYPRVRFNQLTSLSGEGSSAKVSLSLSGDSPVYPVQIDLRVNGILSSVVQADLISSFDISDIHSVVIEETNLEKQANIEFSIVEDYVNEMDELLVFEVAAVESVQGRSDLFIVDEPRSRHELIITEDFDHDGIPDFCSQACLALGIQADSDSDNDGIDNVRDAFEFNAAASVDADNDGQPDAWAETCLAQCQTDSGLIQDPLLNDTDNDGATNDVDTDYLNDNGKPVLLTVPQDMHVAVNTIDGKNFIVDTTSIEALVAQLSGEDAVDDPSLLTAKAYLNDVGLVPDENGEVILPSGSHTINWVAVDSSGNESEPKEQLVFIYPKVRFTSSISIMGEEGLAKIAVELSGDSPDYPVIINLQVNGLMSSVVQSDLDIKFDLTTIPPLIIEGPDAGLKTQILLPIIEDNLNEPDELLVFDIESLDNTKGHADLFVIDQQRSRHALTITEDFDHDGLPNVCNQVCQELGLVADLDNDNDGIENELDAFEFNAAASVDADNDGQPDVWAETCLAQCQADSGLVQDVFLNDTDNDGAPNNIDTDFSKDNGKPTLLTAPAEMHLAANSTDGSTLIVDAASVEALIAQLSAVDAVDDFSLLTAKAYLNDVEILRDENGEVTLPTGLLSINWVAVDSAGNESERLEQLVYVYPQVRFTQLASLSGEGNETEIWVELSGESPEYPVVINVSANASISSASQGDFDEAFVIENNQTIIIEESQANLKNKIVIPVLEDYQPEGDEQLIFEINSLADTHSSSELFVINEQRKVHALTITEDFDHDGLPNVCNQVCQELGLVADLDNDNDGIENELDAFEFNAAASVDADNDGQPDVWAETCLAQCQADSGLVQDPILNDTDNDGAPNDIDTDFERDNGKPILLTVPDTIHVAVNTVDGDGVIVDADAVNWHVAQLLAEDVIDSSEELTAKAYLNNVELIPDENGEVILPSGLLAINWVAVDTSGNESEPLIQLVYVYPQVRFKSITSMVGEASEADIIVELTGDSPEYPVAVELQVNGILSSIVQGDLGENFDLSATHTVVIEQGDDPEMINREGHLRVSIIDDNISENDEYLVVELKSVMGIEQSTHEYIVLAKQDEAHELIVTYRNLAPTVELLVLQNNQAVNSIALDGGQVSLVAIVSDSNGSDRHIYSWNLDGIVVDDLTGGSIVFEPSDFDPREYQISVTVTDNSSNPLSGSISQTITLIDLDDLLITEDLEEEKAPVDKIEVEAEASDSSSGGGAMAWMLLLLMSLAVVGQDRRYTKIEKHLS